MFFCVEFRVPLLCHNGFLSPVAGDKENIEPKRASHQPLTESNASEAGEMAFWVQYSPLWELQEDKEIISFW